MRCHPNDNSDSNKLLKLMEEYEVDALFHLEIWQNPSYLRINRLLEEENDPGLRFSFTE